MALERPDENEPIKKLANVDNDGHFEAMSLCTRVFFMYFFSFKKIPVKTTSDSLQVSLQMKMQHILSTVISMLNQQAAIYLRSCVQTESDEPIINCKKRQGHSCHSHEVHRPLILARSVMGGLAIFCH